MTLSTLRCSPLAVACVTYPHEAAVGPAPAGVGKGSTSEPIVEKSDGPTRPRFGLRLTLTEQEAVLLLALYRQLPVIFDVLSLLDAHRPLCAVVMALKSQHAAQLPRLEQQAALHNPFTVEGNRHV